MLNSQPRPALALPARPMPKSTDAAVRHRVEIEAESGDGPGASGTEPVATVFHINLGLGCVARAPGPKPTRRDSQCPGEAVVAVSSLIRNDDSIDVHPRPNLSGLGLLLGRKRSRHA